MCTAQGYWYNSTCPTRALYNPIIMMMMLIMMIMTVLMIIVMIIIINYKLLSLGSN